MKSTTYTFLILLCGGLLLAGGITTSLPSLPPAMHTCLFGVGLVGFVIGFRMIQTVQVTTRRGSIGITLVALGAILLIFTVVAYLFSFFPIPLITRSYVSDAAVITGAVVIIAGILTVKLPSR